MMMKKQLLLLATCLTLMASVHAEVATFNNDNITQDKPTDLLGVFAQALESDPTFKQAEATLLSQYQNVPITRALLLPQLFASADTAYNHNTNRVKPLLPAG